MWGGKTAKAIESAPAQRATTPRKMKLYLKERSSSLQSCGGALITDCGRVSQIVVDRKRGFMQVLKRKNIQMDWCSMFV